MPPLLEARHIRKVFSSGGGLFAEDKETVAVEDFTLTIDAPEAWLIEVIEAAYDMDNIKLTDLGERRTLFGMAE